MTRTLEILPNELTDGTGTVARRSGSQELFTPLIVIPELSNEPDLQIKLECNSIWIINMNSLVSGKWCHEEELINYFIFWFDAWNILSINWWKFDLIYSYHFKKKMKIEKMILYLISQCSFIVLKYSVLFPLKKEIYCKAVQFKLLNLIENELNNLN